MKIQKRHQINKGNKNAQKMKTPEMKEMAYKSYCDHMALGKSKKSWYFEHPDLKITWQTMEKYIAEDPIVFNPIHKEIAWCKGYQVWEEIVSQSAKGLNKEANTATLQMVMRNKFDWDKENTGQKETSEPLVKTIAARWRKE